jgi:hypothetical protein
MNKEDKKDDMNIYQNNTVNDDMDNLQDNRINNDGSILLKIEYQSSPISSWPYPNLLFSIFKSESLEDNQK